MQLVLYYDQRMSHLEYKYGVVIVINTTNNYGFCLCHNDCHGDYTVCTCCDTIGHGTS